MSADSQCIFCQIVAGEVPSARVFEDERVVAFMDAFPTVRGHVLIVPRAHYTDLHDIDPEDLAACARTAQRIAGRVAGAVDADGFNLLQNTGRAAGQAVFHFHLHVLPRKRGDGLANPIAPKPAELAELEALAAAIRDVAPPA